MLLMILGDADEAVCDNNAIASMRTMTWGREMPWYPGRSHAAFVFKRLKPLVLEGPWLVGRGVIVRLGLGWFGGWVVHV